MNLASASSAADTQTSSATFKAGPAAIASRVAASLLGGWAFTWGFVSLLITAQVALGVAYDNAYTLAMILAFIVFLVAFCWSFAATGLVRIWSILAGGAALMSGAAWWLQKGLV